MTPFRSREQFPRSLAMRVCLLLEECRIIKSKRAKIEPRARLVEILRHHFDMTQATAYRYVSDYLDAKGVSQ